MLYFMWWFIQWIFPFCRNLMPRTLDGQITMEKTPSYFVTKEAPSRLCAMNSDTKLIVVVRDPVTRAVSDYTQTLTKSPGLQSFQKLVFKNSSSGVVDHSWNAVRIGLYAQHLENWLQHFPLSSFLFVSGERLVSDPAGEVGRVQDFLGLKRIVSSKHFYFNQTKGFPCLKKPEGSSRPRCLGKSKGRTHPHIPTDALQKLRDFYRPYNRKFYQMSGLDFGWDWSFASGVGLKRPLNQWHLHILAHLLHLHILYNGESINIYVTSGSTRSSHVVSTLGIELSIEQVLMRLIMQCTAYCISWILQGVFFYYPLCKITLVWNILIKPKVFHEYDYAIL